MSDVRRPARRGRARAAAWLLALSFAALLPPAGQPGPPAHAQSPTPPASAAQPPSAAADEQRARAACAGCHKLPPPSILPRRMWRDEFVRMMFIQQGRLPPLGPPETVNRAIQLPPDMEQALPYYLAGAPERLPLPERWPEPGGPVKFIRTLLTLRGSAEPPAVSSVQLLDLDGDRQLDLLATEMRQGLILTGRPGRPAEALTTVASIPHPARVNVTDLDGDGLRDLLVADLGEFFPADHDKGAVILLRGQASGKFGAFWLDGWPRVADVEAADFNGDGRKDLVVAAFGWRKSGRISILENRTTVPARPDFAPRVLDPRTGGIHAIPADLNRDGHMDVVALLAQEHESVVAYINRGTGDFSFDQKLLYAAPHPHWGSSGIALTDIDGDGDTDILLTHGDSLDDGMVKPYHGIQWLENTGNYAFAEHAIADMPGVHRALPADMDGDGDLDIVAGALLAAGSDVDESVLPALAWLEQTKPGVFARHTIKMGFPRHAALDVGDIDGDGDLDIAAGNFSFDRAPGLEGTIEVWLNQSRR